MPNRTISLCEVTDAIRKKLSEKENFSNWVRKKLKEHDGEFKIPAGPTEYNQVGPTPYSYMCPICKLTGHHWEKNCPFGVKQ